MTPPRAQEFVYMPMGMLVLAPNVREKPGNLEDLADSIRQVGVLEPIICCPHPTETEHFEVLMGQRRFLANRLAKGTHIPALVRPKPSEHERVLLQIAEKIERHFKQALVEGDQAVRDWVSYQVHDYAGRGVGVPKMMQQFNCQMNHEIIKRIKAAAAQEDVVLGEWVEQVLSDAADAVLDGITV